MNKRTQVNAERCPKAVAEIRKRLLEAKEENKDFCIFQGMAYQEIDGEIWLVTIYPGMVSENEWTDKDYKL